MMCHRIGLPPTSTSGSGLRSGSSLSLAPRGGTGLGKRVVGLLVAPPGGRGDGRGPAGGCPAGRLGGGFAAVWLGGGGRRGPARGRPVAPRRSREGAGRGGRSRPGGAT